MPILISSLALLLMTISPASAQTLKYSTFLPKNNPIVRCAVTGTTLSIQKQSNGKIGFEAYLGGSAFGNPNMQYDFIKRGAMDLSSGALAYSPGVFPLSELASLPFLVSDNIKATIALNKLVGRYLKDEYRHIRLMFLGLVPPYQIHMRTPIEKLEDIKGKRVRIAGAIARQTIGIFGAVPVSLNVREAYLSLQRGVVDGTASTWTLALSQKLYEVAKFHYEIDLYSPLVFMGMSKQGYAKLSAESRKIVDAHSTPKYAGKMMGCWSRITAFAKGAAKRKGNIIHRASASDRQGYKKQLSGMIDEIIDGMEKKGKPARKFYNALKAQIAAEDAK